MSADGLDDCMVLASEKDLVDSIDLTKVAKNGHCSKFAAKILNNF